MNAGTTSNGTPRQLNNFTISGQSWSPQPLTPPLMRPHHPIHKRQQHPTTIHPSATQSTRHRRQHLPLTATTPIRLLLHDEPPVAPTSDNDTPILPPAPTTNGDPIDASPATTWHHDDDSYPDVLDVYSTSIHILPNQDAIAVDHYNITSKDIAQAYFSLHCYGHAFEESFQYLGSAVALHPTAGLSLSITNGTLVITDIEPGTPCTKILRWKQWLKHAPLLQLNGMPVSTPANVTHILTSLPHSSRGQCTILVSTPELRDGLDNKGVPQVTLDQLNP